MNSNPSACPHLNLTYDGTFAIVRCMDCDTTWDADQPIPRTRRAPATTAEHDITTSDAYLIGNMYDHHVFWSNRHGWVTRGFDMFTQKERNTLNLPMSGEWIPTPILNPDNEPTSEHMRYGTDRSDNDT